MSQSDVTALLQAIGSGEDEAARRRLMDILYQELRRLAGSFMRRERPGHTLQPTALVNEAYLRLIQGDPRWENRSHFFGAAAQAMRRILVEHARRRDSLKRGGEAVRVTFEDLQVAADDPELDLLALDQALTALAEHDQRLARVVELRYFAGCSLDQVAELLNISKATVKRDWTYAKAWLYDQMSR
jgi:RNA polymerase sigma factor (TIGR02999 family)